MAEKNTALEKASTWGVMREFKHALNVFDDVTTLDMSEPSNHGRLEQLFADYFGILGSESQRFDRPECLIYYRLAQICAPTIFKNPLGADMSEGVKLLGNPGSDIQDKLYTISRETQNINPGRIRLRSAYSFFPNSQIPPNIHPVIMEYDVEGGNTERIARVPLVLTGDPHYPGFVDENLPMISRVAEVIKSSGELAKVDVKHLPYLKSKMRDLQTLSMEKHILDWPLQFTGMPLKTPIVAAFLGDPRLDQDNTQLQSISVTVGGASKEWEVMSKGWTLMPNDERWKYWSFNNTVYQIRNVATENVLRLSRHLSEDILSIDGIAMDKNTRSATLAVHLPILLTASFANTVPDGIVVGFSHHLMEEAAIERARREQEDRFWSSYSGY